MADKGSILIVDDNPGNLQVLHTLLAGAGYRVRPAVSGEIALRAVEANLPDLVLLDVRMPGIDGYETCRRLKADEKTRELPVIFLSAMHDAEDKLAGFQVGGVDYIAKPFHSEEVLARVGAHVLLHRMQQNLEGMVAERTQALSRSEARYRVLFEDSPIPILVFSCDSLDILAVNGAFARIFGYTAKEALGRQLDFAAAPEYQSVLCSLAGKLTEHSEESAYTGLLRFAHKEGEILDIEGVLRRIEYLGEPAQILMLQDITESRRASERLQQVAKDFQQQLEKTTYYDQLTGLPNRALFSQRIYQGLEQVKLRDEWMVVVYLDLDDFQFLNQCIGERVGDQVLIDVADVLRRCLYGGDTLARIGGDEFAMLLLGRRSEEELELFLQQLKQIFAEFVVSNQKDMRLGASVGLTVYPLDDADPDTLLRHADEAMLLAKQVSKGGYRRYDPEGGRRLRAHQESILRMRAALDKREFVLYFQPKVDLETCTVVGAEALIRWQHPERGLLSPGAFLPDIEGDELTADLGDWVIAAALDQMASWRAMGLDLSVSVNVAAMHLQRDNFIARLRELLAKHPEMPKGRLELEVLETSSLEVIGDIEQLIVECRQMGVGFSLDDFGTGYSSLTYLRRLSADTLKIDQSFIRGMLDSPEDGAIVGGIIGLATAFNRRVIAEGVETVEHGRDLLKRGCTQLQGYGIARPMPAQDLPGWASSWPDEEWRRVAREHCMGQAREQPG